MRWLLAPLLLVACTQQPPAPAPVAAQVVQPDPKVTMHVVEGNQLLVMQVTNQNQFGVSESQKCFVWRDTEFKSSTLTCPSNPVYPELVD